LASAKEAFEAEGEINGKFNNAGANPI